MFGSTTLSNMFSLFQDGSGSAGHPGTAAGQQEPWHAGRWPAHPLPRPGRRRQQSLLAAAAAQVSRRPHDAPHTQPGRRAWQRSFILSRRLSGQRASHARHPAHARRTPPLRRQQRRPAGPKLSGSVAGTGWRPLSHSTQPGR